MRRTLARLLRGLGIVEFDLLSRRAATFPSGDEVPAATVVHVRDGAVEKWACLNCPGGCGAMIPLSLAANRRPRWSIRTDWLGRPSIAPSVHQRNDCGCHFWIKGGVVHWCADGRPVRR